MRADSPAATAARLRTASRSATSRSRPAAPRAGSSAGITARSRTRARPATSPAAPIPCSADSPPEISTARSATRPRRAPSAAPDANSIVGGFAGISLGDLVQGDVLRRRERNVGELSRRPRRHQLRQDHGLDDLLERHRQRRAQHRGRPRRRELRIYRSVVFDRQRIVRGQQHRRQLRRRQRRDPLPRRLPVDRHDLVRLERHRHGERRPGQHGRRAGRPDLSDRRTARSSEPRLATATSGGFCGGVLFNPNGQQNPRRRTPRTSRKLAPLLKIVATLVKRHLDREEERRGHQDHEQCDRLGRQRARPAARRAAASKGGGPSARGRPHSACRAVRPRPAAERHAAAQRDALPQQRGGVPARRRAVAGAARRARGQVRARDHLSRTGRAARPHRRALPHHRRPVGARRDRRDREGARRELLGRSRATSSTSTQDLAQGAAPADTTRKGDSAQYIVEQARSRRSAPDRDRQEHQGRGDQLGNRLEASRHRRRDRRQLRRPPLRRPDRASARHRHGGRDRLAPAACSASHPARSSSPSAPSA